MPTVVGAIIMQTPSVGNEIVATADKLLPARKDAIHEAAAFAADVSNLNLRLPINLRLRLRPRRPINPRPASAPHQPPPPPPPGHYERPC